jgi:excinuclease ABC subunit C
MSVTGEPALKSAADRFPDRPGCYIFRDAAGAPLYVGKALSLHARISSYFGAGRGEKETRLAAAAHSLEFVVTVSEREALILENQLIKRHHPPFNVMLRDDKTFPYLKLKLDQKIPQLEFTRKVKKDGALYYGPFLPASGARRVLALARKGLGIATCHETLDGNRGRPCLYYHIHQCLGPCVSSLVTPERYARAVDETRLLLEGKNQQLMTGLGDAMRAASEGQRYEEAAQARDTLRDLAAIGAKSAVDWATSRDADAVGFSRLHRRAALVILALRGGRVVDKDEYFITEPEESDGETIAQALCRYYERHSLPPLLYLDGEFPEVETAITLLAEEGKTQTRIKTPARGAPLQLLKMAQENSLAVLNARMMAAERWAQIAGAMQQALSLPAPPRRICCFDISNLGKKEIVASMSVLMDGRAAKSEYRRFKIKHQSQQNDFAALQEAVLRHLTRAQSESTALPDLLLIDGGKGQLSAVQEVIDPAGFDKLPLASLAKREEWVYLRDGRGPVTLDKHDPVLQALQRVRDEAHRFAITYHRKRRAMVMTHSFLDDVPGIGPEKKKKLLKHFITLDTLKSAELEKLQKLLGKRAGGRLHEVLQKV